MLHMNWEGYFKDGDGVYKNIDLAEEYYERAADIDYSFTKPKIILKTKNGREKLIKFVGLCNNHKYHYHWRYYNIW